MAFRLRSFSALTTPTNDDEDVNIKIIISPSVVSSTNGDISTSEFDKDFIENNNICLVSNNDKPSEDGLNMYDERLFERGYYSPKVGSELIDLQVSVPKNKIISLTQFGNFCFSLTSHNGEDPSFKSKLSTTEEEPTEENSIIIYDSSKNTSKEQMEDSEFLDSNIITKSIFSTENSTLYGVNTSTTANPEYILFVKDSSVSEEEYLAYTYDQNCGPIKKNYILEDRMPPLSSNVSDLYGVEIGSGNINVFVNDASVASPTAYYKDYKNDASAILDYLFTPTKNIYNNDWEVDLEDFHSDYNHTTSSEKRIKTIRRYSQIGENNSSMWLKYRVFSAGMSTLYNMDEAELKTSPTGEKLVSQKMVDIVPSVGLNINNTTTYYNLYEYEMVERIYGVNKFIYDGGHKSNIFSIEIENSGIKALVEDDRTKLKPVIIESVKKFIKKITPVNTQIWKVSFTGK